VCPEPGDTAEKLIKRTLENIANDMANGPIEDRVENVVQDKINAKLGMDAQIKAGARGCKKVNW
jgi:hypothetical protein